MNSGRILFGHPSYISFWTILSFTFGWLFFPKNFFLFFCRFACFFFRNRFFSFLRFLFSFSQRRFHGRIGQNCWFSFLSPLALFFLGTAYSKGRRFSGRGSAFSVLELWAVEVNGWGSFSGLIFCSIRAFSSHWKLHIVTAALQNYKFVENLWEIYVRIAISSIRNSTAATKSVAFWCLYGRAVAGPRRRCIVYTQGCASYLRRYVFV